MIVWPSSCFGKKGDHDTFIVLLGWIELYNPRQNRRICAKLKTLAHRQCEFFIQLTLDKAMFLPLDRILPTHQCWWRWSPSYFSVLLKLSVVSLLQNAPPATGVVQIEERFLGCLGLPKLNGTMGNSGRSVLQRWPGRLACRSMRSAARARARALNALKIMSHSAWRRIAL